MTKCTGFAPISRPDARVLILGTLPSVKSLAEHQYYAKPQNAFWKIMGDIVGAGPDLPYKDRLEQLKENRIALWDVCATAEREGSLDAAIRAPQPNDFATFFKTHRDIERICFNGKTAEKLFRHHVGIKMPHVTLPSTSPAHAGMGYRQKLIHWRKALRG
ncbi:MAG: DNA-deoxyinosine glycosylase [Alphaproteobacteria bacterium]|nr:DNA-deoxyinosine glycosylase [Alphaproteobacteria bacterium]